MAARALKTHLHVALLVEPGLRSAMLPTAVVFSVKCGCSGRRPCNSVKTSRKVLEDASPSPSRLWMVPCREPPTPL